MDKLNLSNV